MKSYLVIIICLFIYSCDGVTGPSSQDLADSEISVELANEALEDALQVLYNPDTLEDCDDGIDCLQLINFANVHTLFEQALALNPDNLDAHFGVGITNLLMITQDQNMYDSINEWINYFDDDAIAFNNDNIFPTIDNILSFDFSNMLNLIPIQNNILLHNSQNPPPELSDIQDLLETSFLNRLTESINHFNIVLENDYTFTLSGAMQGDNSIHSMDMDNTEIYLLKSQMHLFSSIINLIIAYDFDIPHYDMLITECYVDDYYEYGNHNYITYFTFADYSWLNQNSNFLSIKNPNALPLAHDHLNEIYVSLTSAIDYLQNETDSQVDDMILESNLLVDEISQSLEDFNLLINENQTMEDEDGLITINFSNFLNSPIDNLKSLIPQYNIINISQECNDTSFYKPSLNFTASSWEEFKNQINDPTIGGLFPEFDIDHMLNYMDIECDSNNFDFEDCD